MHHSIRFAAAAALLGAAPAALAHDGHLLTGSHWHATDLWGFVALAAAAGLALWLGGGDR